MAETPSHKRAKNSAAGAKGETEAPLSRNRRLDALTASGDKATEIERGGTDERLEKAARRLKASDAEKKVLQVPQWDMIKAAEAMRKIGVKGTVTNMGETKRRKV
jgi:hypothetical protein